MRQAQAISRLLPAFRSVTGLAAERCDPAVARPASRRPDAVLAAGRWRFLVEYKAAATAEQVGAALRQMASWSEERGTPVLVVPYMGETGRRLCSEAGFSWLDLSGNADIVAAGLRIRVLGEPNRFKRRGRPASLFAPRSSRVARVLLLAPDRSYGHGELAELTGLSSGFLSRLLPRYVEAGFVARASRGRAVSYRVTAADRLLSAWHAAYEFAEHTVVRGHVAARSGPELARVLAAGLSEHAVEHAATGLAAAWLWEPHAAFRTATIYLSRLPSAELLAELGVHEGMAGSNTWLVVPNDDGVFTGAEVVDGVRCVSAVQTYLDLKGHPERAEEAAKELRRRYLTWPSRAEGAEP